MNNVVKLSGDRDGDILFSKLDDQNDRVVLVSNGDSIVLESAGRRVMSWSWDCPHALRNAIEFAEGFVLVGAAQMADCYLN